MKWPKPLSKLSKGLAMGEGRRSASRLVLGTAQLGMAYGIANRSGKPDFKTALSIVQAAFEGGVVEFDTAQAYGESETVLGSIFAELGITKDVKVTTKLDPRLSPLTEGSLLRSVEQSFERLRIEQLEGFLLHREEMIDTLGDDLDEALLGLVRNGYVGSLGVSVYSPEMARQALGTDLFRIVHLPSSILDRRFRNAGIFEMAQRFDKRIYIRSAFLQGLLLMDTVDVPQGLAPVRPVLEELDGIAARYRSTRQAMALVYLRDRFENAKVIFGAETLGQVKQNIGYWNGQAPSGLLKEIENIIPELDESILNPSRWFH